MKRIALGGLWHETNTFAPDRTDLDGFRRYQLRLGDELVDTYAGTGTELGGAIDEALTARVKVVPLAFAAATPSGLVTNKAYEWIACEIVRRVANEDRLDGVVLCLHGAMVAEGQQDVEANLVRRVRSAAPDLPLAVTLDLHANLSAALCASANVVVGYDTFPHVDMADRGAEALRIVLRMAKSGARPRARLEKLPLLTVPQKQETHEEPLRSAFASLFAAEASDRVWTASLLPGFPYSDVKRLGFSVYVAADTDGDAEQLARRLAAEVWEQRAAFTPQLLDPEDALREEDTAPAPGPVVLVDVADNVGGGSPGDGTVLLRALEERGRADGVVVVWDPACIAELYGSDATRVTVSVGGRSAPEMGGPVAVSGAVRRFGRVRYDRTGLYMRGQSVDMGRVAVLASKAGEVVVTENRIMPFDDDHLRVLGIEPELRRIIVVKSATAWKGAFLSYAARALFVRTPGYCPSDLRQLPFSSWPRSLYPLRKDARWPST